MKALALALLVLIAAPATLAQNDGGRSFAEAWAPLAERLVTPDGLVRYARLNGPDAEALDDLLRRVAEADPATLRSDAEHLAFWVNAYNVLFLDRARAAVRRGPVGRIDEAFPFYFEAPVRAAGERLTLDAIEHGILRRQGGAPQALVARRVDPRIHAVLHCGAVSCPVLRPVHPDRLDAQLDTAMRDWVGSERFARRDARGWSLSSLVEWFAADFEAAGEPGGTYLARFIPPDRPHAEALRTLLYGRLIAAIRHDVRMGYDWRLNAAP